MEHPHAHGGKPLIAVARSLASGLYGATINHLLQNCKSVCLVLADPQQHCRIHLSPRIFTRQSVPLASISLAATKVHPRLSAALKAQEPLLPRTFTRGKWQRPLGRSHHPRFIPAHAGKSAVPVLAKRLFLGSSPLTRGKVYGGAHWSPLAAVHPRSRGGKHGPWRDDERYYGSSPLTRGKAGKNGSWGKSGGGSSPLTRGKADVVQAQGGVIGFIPAHAGERKTTSRCKNREPGSSPLTRGKVVPGNGRHLHGGFIPAHAGESEVARKEWRMSSGSSPLTRGKVSQCPASVQIVQGSSPLTRGKGRRENRSPPGSAVHPRSRGGKPSCNRPFHNGFLQSSKSTDFLIRRRFVLISVKPSKSTTE